jgi:hypothetical protein
MSAFVVTEPGVYDGMPDDVYHADPVAGGSLSSTGARKLLPPSCPALFRWWADHGQPPQRAFDFGHAAHRLVLGIGPEIVAVDYDDWRTKDARERRDAAYAAGQVPLLAPEYTVVEEMAAALRAHPIAGALFTAPGDPEQSMFWTDGDRPNTLIWRRARVDWFPRWSGSGRLIVPDYKTCRSAEPAACAKAMADYGYYMQAAWYLDAVRVLGLADEAAFVFVFQQKDPPYLITVCEPDREALAVGELRNREAVHTYRRCRAAGHWPDYSDGRVLPLSLPRWALYQLEESA